MNSVPADLDAAIQRYEGFIRLDPGNSLLWLSLGEMYHRAGRFDEAIACLERSVMEGGNSKAARSRIALVQISQHRFADAERLLRELTDEEPDAAALHYNLGLTLFYQHRFEEAHDRFSHAIALGLASSDGLGYLTRSLHHLGRMSEAIERCGDWIAQAQDDSAKAYLALLEMDEGNLGRAREIAQDVLARNPDNIEAATVVGTASVELQDIDQAERLFERILERQKDNGRAWLGLGMVRLYQQRHADAIAALEEAERLMPEHTGTVVALAWSHLAARDAVEAERVFRRAILVEHNFSEAHGGLAAALALQGRVDEAQVAMRTANKLDPANFGGRFAQSILLKLRGRDTIATELLAELLQRSPGPGTPSLIEHLRTYSARHMQDRPQVTPVQHDVRFK